MKKYISVMFIILIMINIIPMAAFASISHDISNVPIIPQDVDYSERDITALKEDAYYRFEYFDNSVLENHKVEYDVLIKETGVWVEGSDYAEVLRICENDSLQYYPKKEGTIIIVVLIDSVPYCRTEEIHIKDSSLYIKGKALAFGCLKIFATFTATWIEAVNYDRVPLLNISISNIVNKLMEGPLAWLIDIGAIGFIGIILGLLVLHYYKKTFLKIKKTYKKNNVGYLFFMSIFIALFIYIKIGEKTGYFNLPDATIRYYSYDLVIMNTSLVVILGLFFIRLIKDIIKHKIHKEEILCTIGAILFSFFSICLGVALVMFLFMVAVFSAILMAVAASMGAGGGSSNSDDESEYTKHIKNVATLERRRYGNFELKQNDDGDEFLEENFGPNGVGYGGSRRKIVEKDIHGKYVKDEYGEIHLRNEPYDTD